MQGTTLPTSPNPKTQGDAFPKGDVITFEFPAQGSRGPVTLVWHSGTEKIPRAKELGPEPEPVESSTLTREAKAERAGRG